MNNFSSGDVLFDHETPLYKSQFPFRSNVEYPIDLDRLRPMIKNGTPILIVNTRRLATDKEPASVSTEIAFTAQEDLDAFLAICESGIPAK